MQNTMLDTVVSSNSQELFDFNAEHNGEACIESLDPKDKWTERQFWFTVAMLCVIYGVARKTLEDNIQSLSDDGEFSMADFRRTEKVPASDGKLYETTIYNLEVLNKLGMCCFRGNKKAKEIRNKFNDVLVKHETGVKHETQVQPELTDAEIMSRALEIAHRTLALREERIKALTAERDEAIRTKAQIGSSREATAMNTASQKSKECAKLTAENAKLKDAVGRGTNWHTIAMMRAEWKREFGHAPSSQKLKEFSADLPADMQPVRDVEVKVVLPTGSEKVDKLFRYHREAWAKYREYEENRRDKDKNVPDTKILDLSATDTEVEYF